MCFVNACVKLLSLHSGKHSECIGVVLTVFVFSILCRTLTAHNVHVIASALTS